MDNGAFFVTRPRLVPTKVKSWRNLVHRAVIFGGYNPISKYASLCVAALQTPRLEQAWPEHGCLPQTLISPCLLRHMHPCLFVHISLHRWLQPVKPFKQSPVS